MSNEEIIAMYSDQHYGWTESQKRAIRNMVIAGREFGRIEGEIIGAKKMAASTNETIAKVFAQPQTQPS